MAICAYCHKKLDEFPFTCKFCGRQFCSDHRLPENHDCRGLEAYKEQQQESIKTTKPEKPIEYFYDKGEPIISKKKSTRTPKIIMAISVLAMISGFIISQPILYYAGFIFLCAAMIKYLMP